MTLEYILRETTPKEYLKIIAVNYDCWGPPLSNHDYIDREFTLSKIAGESRQSWVLLGGDAILSSCETYKRPLSARIDGEIINGWSFGVASV